MQVGDSRYGVCGFFSSSNFDTLNGLKSTMICRFFLSSEKGGDRGVKREMKYGKDHPGYGLVLTASLFIALGPVLISEMISGITT